MLLSLLMFLLPARSEVFCAVSVIVCNVDNSTHYCFNENHFDLYNRDCRGESNLICVNTKLVGSLLVTNSL